MQAGNLGSGVLNAWIDFNGNGVFEATDQIAVETNPAHAISTGSSITLTGTAPADTGSVSSTLYSRFRFTATAGQGGNSPTGEAQSGEVEDYVLMSLGDLLWYDNGAGGGTPNNGILDGGETGVHGVTVELYSSNQTPGTVTPIATTTTDNGRYLFTGLSPDADPVTSGIQNYVVHIPFENFNEDTDPLYRYYSTTGVNDDDTINEVNAGNANSDNGNDQTNPASTGISSSPISLTIAGEPTDDQPAGAAVDDDPNSNLTVDFGFLQYDYGDAPDSYGTTDSAGGARHPLDGVTFLGTLVDADTDGIPSVNADGDDSEGTPDDEDGVVFSSPIMLGKNVRSFNHYLGSRILEYLDRFRRQRDIRCWRTSRGERSNRHMDRSDIDLECASVGDGHC